MFLLILAVVSAMLVYGLIAGMLGTILPAFARKFGLTSIQMGRMALAQAAGLVISSFAAGPLIGASSKKAALTGALVLVAFGLWALPRARGFRAVVAALFLIDCGGGTIVEAANSFAFELGTLLTGMTKSNLLNASFCVGGVLTSLIAANFCREDATKVLRVLYVAALGALAVNLLNPVEGTVPSATGLWNVGALAGDGRFWLVSLLFFFAIAAEAGVWNWLTPHLISQGLSERSALNILSLGFAMGLLVGRMAVAPFIPPDASTVKVTLIAAVVAAVATYYMLRVQTARLAGGVVFIAGVAMGPVFPNCIAITGSAFPNDPTALGLALVAGWLGMAVSSRVIGAVAGDGGARLGQALRLLPGASALLAGTCWILLR